MNWESLPCAQEIEVLFPRVWRWSAYSVHHKVELTSHAVMTEVGLIVIDPIPLDEAQQVRLETGAPVQGVIITNANHFRATGQWRGKKIYTASLDLVGEPNLEILDPESLNVLGLQIISLPGGPGGEIALFDSEKKLLIMGDALVNLPTRGLEVLPANYCDDEPLLRKSLANLLALNFDRLLCAHGSPIMTGAKLQLEELLAKF